MTQEQKNAISTLLIAQDDYHMARLMGEPREVVASIDRAFMSAIEDAYAIGVTLDMIRDEMPEFDSQLTSDTFDILRKSKVRA